MLYFAFTTISNLDRNISSDSKYHKASREVFLLHDPIPPPLSYTLELAIRRLFLKICFPNYITGTICHTKIFEKFSSLSERERILNLS